VRHLKRGRKLGRKTGPRKALKKLLVNALFTHGRIVTTLPKAKETRPFAEKLITLARKGMVAKDRGEGARFLHCYRRAISELSDKAVAKKLFTEIAPLMRDRPGGYTRILKDAKPRLGDNGVRAIFELVEFTPPAAPEKAEKAEKAGKAAKAAKAKKARKAAKGTRRPGKARGEDAEKDRESED
jgi:large subunit ribosomal protein L17